MTPIDCDETFAEPIRAILNEAIVNSVARYEYVPRPPESMADWFAAKRRGGFPVLGIVTDAGELMGFATYGPFRDIPGYKYTVEHSVYVDAAYRGRGVGRALLAALIDRARCQDYHALIGVIDASNVVSVALHQSFGFVHVGTMPQVGFKFGRWLDVSFYQLLLDTPANPVDG